MLTYYYNGNILTMNQAAPKAPHMLISEGRIAFCDEGKAPLGLDFRASDFSQVREKLAGQVKFIDLGGKTVIPGICDSHAHFIWWGFTLTEADLTPTRSEAECIEVLRKHAANLEKGAWVTGHGWTHNLWEKPELPTRESLDKLFPENPVFLSSKCGHLGWANSLAMEMAGLTDDTPDPDGGELERKNGHLTGILKELAMEPVANQIAAPTTAQRFEALRLAQSKAHSYGITSMQTPEDMVTWEFLQNAHALKKLTMRINFWIPVSRLDALCEANIRHGLGDTRLRISAVKLFADGSLGGRTADMYEPYENEPDNYGVVVTDAETILAATMKANGAGLSMAIHAIGDRAVGHVLTAYEAAAAEYGTDGDTRTNPVLRNRIEHLQVYADRDFDRIKNLKPIISFQPIHLCADMVPADRYWGSRARNAYACRTVADAGCLLVFGSDVPVESCNPFYGLYAAITRNNMEGNPGDGWNPQEKITLQEALEAYTINPATASGLQDELGSLQTGKLADFVVLPEDPFAVTPEALRDMQPVATYSEGKCVYANDSWKERV